MSSIPSTHYTIYLFFIYIVIILGLETIYESLDIKGNCQMSNNNRYIFWFLKGYLKIGGMHTENKKST